MIEYTLIRTNRKTVAICVTRDAVVKVRAPLGAGRAEIDRIVASKQDWIQKYLNERNRQLERKEAFSVRYGDSAIVRGRACPIAAADGHRAWFDGERFHLPPGLSPKEVKYVVVRLYRLIAKQVLTERTLYYARRTGLTPSAVKVNGAKTRWGSSSANGSINFSWRLLMAEDDAIDYVVVHELMHIKEPNHSSRFWASVAAVLPDYKAREAKLKELQRRLANEDWD